MSDKLELNQELVDGLKAISEINNAKQRQAVTMLDDSLEENLGYKTKIVYAAGLLAQRLHAGQIDKGGNDYFKGHLLNVAKLGFNWKENVTGFLHDAAEDCNVTVAQVMEMLDREIDHIAGSSQVPACEEDWWQDWMDEFMPYPAGETHLLTDEERAQIAETLNLMNHHSAATRAEYIARFRGHPLAIKTKLHDLANNMDLSRIPMPTQKDLDRVDRYRKEQVLLQEMLTGS